MAIYKRIVAEIEARHFETNNDNGECLDSLVCWILSCGHLASHDGTSLRIYTSGGIMTAQCSDMIVKDVNGEFHPCKLRIFDKNYAKIGE